MPRVVTVIAAVLVAGSLVRADPATADRAVAEAEKRAQAKDYVGAAAKYREAYAADPRPDLICNVGVAYYKAQVLTRAQLFLGRCLERGSSLDAAFMTVVRATLAKLETTLRSGGYTPVDIAVEPRFATVSIGSFEPDETFDGGRTVWLAFGTERVTVRADGYVEKTIEVDAKDQAILPVRITLDKQPISIDRGSAAIEPPPTGSATGSATVVGPAPESPSAAPAIATTIVTVGLAAFAVYAAIDARGHADRATLALSEAAFRSEADAVTQWNTIFGVDVALAGVAAVASGYLWYRITRHPSPTSVEVTSRSVSIGLVGRF